MRSLQAPQSSWRLRLPQFSWLHAFVLVQFLLQILLLFPEISGFRIVMRAGAFALSLGLLWKVPKTGIQHPAKPWAIAVLCIMLLQFFWHPYLSSLPAGFAQCLMYLAILAPLFWVSRLKLSDEGFYGLIYLLWGFHTLSSIVGVLQVYYPEVFQFAVSSVIEEGQYGGDQLKITLANGSYIYRPAGLSDTPGSAAISGFYALLLGTGIALQARNLVIRLISTASVPIGLFCIYLSQVRSTLIVSLICLLVIALVLIQLKRFGQVAIMAGTMIVLAIATTHWAVGIGGEMLSDRFLSLLAESPDTVIYQNRGVFLEETIVDLIPKYPFGAGLGRWGMMNDYFGNNYNPLTYPLWAEIQWTGWVFDGGIPLVVAYSGAIIAACCGVWRVISDRFSPLQLWAGIIFAYNMGAIAITFGYPLFMSQAGMEFWLINTALFVAARRSHTVLSSWEK
ncbi:hypothetical protein [Leptolyngbya sp. NIES-2104]|uniref:hypothetical protein n=1 Tax=Leptolyngbya sp. NIES-2104 TaxID=1552121 RepID=UPI0006EC7958|nr:hypothetical protein [Leptolyngbya sp. NIES-2104]GAP95132.1 hypothetical protein NIES2104_16520 [Leptolyngbya sp. NIES-2104]